MPKTKKKLTDKQAAFVREYMVDRNATQAAIRAGYSAKNASRIGPEVLGKTWVADEIRRREEALEVKSGITVEKMLKMLFEDYEWCREQMPSGKPRDGLIAQMAADKIMKALGGYDKDNRRRLDAELKIVWGGEKDTDEND